MEKLFSLFLIDIRPQIRKTDKFIDITVYDYGWVGWSGNILLFTLHHSLSQTLNTNTSVLLFKENIWFYNVKMQKKDIRNVVFQCLNLLNFFFFRRIFFLKEKNYFFFYLFFYFLKKRPKTTQKKEGFFFSMLGTRIKKKKNAKKQVIFGKWKQVKLILCENLWGGFLLFFFLSICWIEYNKLFSGEFFKIEKKMWFYLPNVIL